MTARMLLTTACFASAEAFCLFGWGWGCPPTCPKVAPVADLDLDRYTSQSWFIQKQQVNPYQSADELYCVSATYERRADGFLTVNNYGNKGQVNGEPMGVDGGAFSTLCAQPQRDAEGSLKVAPCLFKPVFGLVAGPYWVLAVGADYEWAIVSGGQPTEVREHDPLRCTTKKGSSFLDINGSGLWLFTRARVAPAETVQEMERVLQGMGVSTVDLRRVAQKGCTYAGASLKEA
eukprot:TRINITY_DN20366_c0_g1_i1.p1 TRINITY_DN20366_c0_g1~~TRINITY_DN20366_c0_g1_i1.p1  ORF type:complete len:233 (+),score=93.82 TRINITY_DN20366_c0_g1_i1:63-761(+)